MPAARLIPVAWLALALAGCGGTAAAPAGELAELLARAQERIREEGSFGFSFHYTRTRADRPDDPEQYVEGDGAVDLGAGAGRMTIELDFGLPEEPLESPIELRWTPAKLSVVGDGQNYELRRERARSNGGLIGRMPDEPAGLIDLLGKAADARDEGAEKIDGVDVRRVSFVVDARAAGREGVPPELSLAAQQGGLGARLPLETWIDEEGLVRRIAYEVSLPEQRLRPSGRLILPKRMIRGVYDLSEFARPL